MKILNAIYSLKSAENMNLYHALKNRFGKEFSDREEFILDTAKKLKPILINYAHIFIPESSSDLLEKITQQTEISYTIVKKKKIEDIMNLLPTLNLQKKEKESILLRIEDMEGVFKINKLKANQRRKFEHFLFESVTPKENSIILDDSSFSGTTIRAMSKSTQCNISLSIFSKEH